VLKGASARKREDTKGLGVRVRSVESGVTGFYYMQLFGEVL